jgi:uncharacterized membrane protein
VHNFLSLAEVVALVVIVRLWMNRRHNFVPRLLWSVVLLVPLFGLLAYVFLRSEPEAHPYNIPDTYQTGSSSADTGGHSGGHSGDGH